MLVAVPLKFNAGVNVTVPPAFTVQTPCAVVSLCSIPTVLGSKSIALASNVLSTSTSFANTFTVVTALSSVAVALLPLAIGASFTGLTVTFIIPILDIAPSLSLIT